jgi:hypothetical protein
VIPDEEFRVLRHRRCPFAAPQPDRAQGSRPRSAEPLRRGQP